MVAIYDSNKLSLGPCNYTMAKMIEERCFTGKEPIHPEMIFSTPTLHTHYCPYHSRWAHVDSDCILSDYAVCPDENLRLDGLILRFLRSR